MNGNHRWQCKHFFFHIPAELGAIFLCCGVCHGIKLSNTGAATKVMLSSMYCAWDINSPSSDYTSEQKEKNRHPGRVVVSLASQWIHYGWRLIDYCYTKAPRLSGMWGIHVWHICWFFCKHKHPILPGQRGGSDKWLRWLLLWKLQCMWQQL